MLYERVHGINSSPTSTIETPLLLDWETFANVSEGAKKREYEEAMVELLNVHVDTW